MNCKCRQFLLIATVVFCGACTSTKTHPGASGHESENLRDDSNDVLFATEFPVADKADALSRAKASREAGEIDKALFFYVKALKFDSQDAEVLAAIGLLHQLKGDDLMAVRAFTLALKANPDFAEVREARGLILLAHGEDERAYTDLSLVIEVDPKAWQAHNGLGLIADRNGDHRTAIFHYDVALELNPGTGSVLNNRGYSKLLAGFYGTAEADLLEAANNSGFKQAWVNLGALYARQREYAKAVEALQNVLPEPQAFNKVAEASIASGDYQIAEDLLEHAIRLSPTYFPAAQQNLVDLRTARRGG